MKQNGKITTGVWTVFISGRLARGMNVSKLPPLAHASLTQNVPHREDEPAHQADPACMRWHQQAGTLGHDAPTRQATVGSTRESMTERLDIARRYFGSRE